MTPDDYSYVLKSSIRMAPLIWNIIASSWPRSLKFFRSILWSTINGTQLKTDELFRVWTNGPWSTPANQHDGNRLLISDTMQTTRTWIQASFLRNQDISPLPQPLKYMATAVGKRITCAPFFLLFQGPTPKVASIKCLTLSLCCPRETFGTDNRAFISQLNRSLIL